MPKYNQICPNDTSAGCTADIEPSSARYFSSNLPISCAMLESGFCLTVELTAARISQRFTSEPLSVMFLYNDGFTNLCAATLDTLDDAFHYRGKMKTVMESRNALMEQAVKNGVRQFLSHFFTLPRSLVPPALSQQS